MFLRIYRASFWAWSHWLRDAREIPLSGKSDFDVQMLICLLVLELGFEPRSPELMEHFCYIRHPIKVYGM